MGLLKTAAKVGVASAVHGRVQRRQQLRWAAEDQAAAAAAPPQQGFAAPPPPAPAQAPPAAPAPAPDMDAKLEQLRQLGELRDSGILNEAEFEAKKALILGL